MLICTQLLFIGVAVNIWKMSKQSKNQVQLIEAANQFLNGSAYLTDEVRAYAATGDQIHYDNYWKEINEYKNREKGYETMVRIGITDSEETMIKKMSDISNALVPLEENAMKNVQKNKKAEALEYVYGKQYDESITEIRTLQSKFISDLQIRIEDSSKKLTIGNILLTTVAIIFLFASMGVLIFTHSILKKKIIAPILVVRDHCLRLAEGDMTTKIALKEDQTELGMLVNGINTTQKNLKIYISELTRLLDEIANGNFTVESQIQFKGDFVQINESIKDTLEQLNRTMIEIRNSAEQVSISANEVSLGAHDLANGATEQAGSIQELNAMVEEISANVKENATTIQDAHKHTKMINSTVYSSNESMQKMLEAMRKIQTQSEAINNIIQSIEDIAFQTNILSLNAAIEAERAGESGKGFSVVADEVRKLANQTSESVKITTELIQSSLDAVKHGSEIAQNTAESMEKVVTGTQEIEQTIERISRTSNEQSEAISQISVGISQITAVVETNSATSQQSAAASVELSEQSNKMKGLIEQFRVQ